MMSKKAIYSLAAIVGAFFAAAAYILFLFIMPEDALLLALFCGVGMYVLLAGYMLIHSAVVDKRYEMAEKNITSPVQYKTNGNFQLENGRIANGNIYFCDDGIVFASLESRPYGANVVGYDEIERFCYDDSHFSIYIKDGRVYNIMVPYASQIVEILEGKGILERRE